MSPILPRTHCCSPPSQRAHFQLHHLPKKGKRERDVRLPLPPIINNMCVPSGVNIKSAYGVFFQWLHEKGIPEDQPAVLRHLRLLLGAGGSEKERRKVRRLVQKGSTGRTTLCHQLQEKVMPSLYPSGLVFTIQNPWFTTLPYETLILVDGRDSPKADLRRHRWRGRQVICLALDS